MTLNKSETVEHTALKEFFSDAWQAVEFRKNHLNKTAILIADSAPEILLFLTVCYQIFR